LAYQENQTTRFSRSYKKLFKRELESVHTAMDTIVKKPEIGTEKLGDLSNLFVYKFKVGKTEWMLGYTFNSGKKIVTWHSIGQHENFYRDAKRNKQN
jgi:mRNA-degrading endonuclease RelE of RelBE toxin-antitoxin system